MSGDDPASTGRALALPGELANLPGLVSFVLAACERAGCGPEATFAVRLAVEEVFTNIAGYGYAGGPPGPVTVSIGREPAGLVVTIEDRARPFDPEDAPPPDLDSPWEDRRVGGLGWHLIRELMDDVRYERADGVNRLTLVKALPDPETR